MPPESLPHIVDQIMKMGANNIHILNAITKKGRLEHIVLVDTDEKHLDDICSLLALEFGTLGIKIIKYDHIKFPYEVKSKNVTIQADDDFLEMEVRVKFVEKDDKIISLKAEYEDIQSTICALNSKGINIPIAKLKALIEAEAYKDVLKDKNISIKVN
jgi:uncharacterized protein (DUF111 family)